MNPEKLDAKCQVLHAVPYFRGRVLAVIFQILLSVILSVNGATPVEEHDAYVSLMNAKPSTLSIEDRERVVRWLRGMNERQIERDNGESLYEMMLVKFSDTETIERLAKTGQLEHRWNFMAEGGALEVFPYVEPALFKVEELKFGTGDAPGGHSISHYMAATILITLRNADKAPVEVRTWARTFDQRETPSEKYVEIDLVKQRELVKRWFNTNRKAITERRWNDLVPGEPLSTIARQTILDQPVPEREVKRIELRPQLSDASPPEDRAQADAGTGKPAQERSSKDWFGILGLGAALIASALAMRGFASRRGVRGQAGKTK